MSNEYSVIYPQLYGHRQLGHMKKKGNDVLQSANGLVRLFLAAGSSVVDQG